MNAEAADISKYEHPDWDMPIHEGSYVHALVTTVYGTHADVKFGKHWASLLPADYAWTKHKSCNEILARGDIVYVKVLSFSPDGTAHVSLEQDSGAQGALLAIDNSSGDVKAMVGGRDFDLSKFNRATQAQRQVGSSFKPYVYTAAIDQDKITPDDMILDTPITFPTASGPYTPHNYDGKFEGNITHSACACRFAQHPRTEDCLRPRHQDCDRLCAQVRHQLADSAGASGRARRRRSHLDGADQRFHRRFPTTAFAPFRA